jgi:hypothetical protein
MPSRVFAFSAEVKLASRRKNYGNAHVKILYFLETDYIFLK